MNARISADRSVPARPAAALNANQSASGMRTHASGVPRPGMRSGCTYAQGLTQATVL